MKRFLQSLKLFPFLLFAFVVYDCGKDEGAGGINLFSVQDDIEFGQQLSNEIESNPEEYPVIYPDLYPEAYDHITMIRDEILATDKVTYDEEFVWQVRIIDDTILNAFAAPGGYMYFYTGLIKFLDNEAEFAGVMGHEMAHAAQRHSTQQLTKVYGIQILLSVVLGENPSKAAEIAAGLATGLSALAFSRDNEYEADEKSVRYLYDTEWDARGVAGFFEKLEGSPSPPTFLSTHPSPEDRVEKIHELWEQLGGKEGQLFESRYLDFKNSLP